MTHTATISIRAASPSDGRTLTRLAALDSAPVPFGPVLIADVDGEPKAALSLRDDRVIADPFFRTTELVDLLRMHGRTVAQAEEQRVERAPLGRMRFAA